MINRSSTQSSSAPSISVDLEREDRARQQAATWDLCQNLAQRPDILSAFVEVQARRGVISPARVLKLVYLVLTSRVLDRPVSAAIKGPSGAGKSYPVEHTLPFFPSTAYRALSSMSERALVYDNTPLQHKILILFEAAGLNSRLATYFLRSLLSEGCVRYVTTEATKDGLKSREIWRPGPTGLLTTTTAVRLDPELETRLLSIPVSDAPEQTAKVLRALAEEDGSEDEVEGEDEGVFAPWVALQTWLDGAEHRAVIPFGGVLSDAIPPVAVRLRRDVGLLRALVKSHAILHLASRKRDRKGRVVAELRDYAAVRELIADLVAEGVGATVSSAMRQTVEAVRACLGRHAAAGDGWGVSLAALAAALGIDKSSASRRVKAALDAGYIKNLAAEPGRPLCLVLGEPLPEAVQVLPTVEDLADRCGVAS